MNSIVYRVYPMQSDEYDTQRATGTSYSTCPALHLFLFGTEHESKLIAEGAVLRQNISPCRTWSDTDVAWKRPDICRAPRDICVWFCWDLYCRNVWFSQCLRCDHQGYNDGLAQNCSNSIADTLELLQARAEPSINKIGPYPPITNHNKMWTMCPVNMQ